MTRYLCSDASHLHDGKLHPVDVTPQVRLERELMPRGLAYLATTESVIEGLAERPSDRSIAALLTGTDEPIDAPVILASERAVLFHRPGLHEVDELRRTEPAIDRLIHGPRARGDEFVVLHAAENPPEGPTSQGEGTQATAVATTETVERADTTPQGVFDLWDLSSRLTTAEPGRAALEDAIRHAPRSSLAVEAGPDAPWRVVITCPTPEGTPPIHHDTVFTGVGIPEAQIVQGTPVDGLDAVLERDADLDLAPAAELARTERRLAGLLGAEIVVTLLVLAGAWGTGALATAAREAPGWLAFGFTLVAASVAFGGIALLAPKDPAGNVNDIYTVRRFYSSRMQLLHTAMAASAAGWALGLLTAIVPPLMVADQPHPAAIVRFTPSGTAIVASVEVHADGLPSGTDVRVLMRSYASAEDPGTIIGLVTATSDPEGVVDLSEEMAVPTGADFFGVQIRIEGLSQAMCSPMGSIDPGCTIVAVPGGSVVPTSTVVGVPVATLPSSSPSPTVTVSPSVPTLAP